MPWGYAAAAVGGALLSSASNSPSAPAQQDYGAAAQAQGQANIAAAQAQTQLNRPNQITPWGSQMWYQGTPGSYNAPPATNGGTSSGGTGPVGGNGGNWGSGWTPGGGLQVGGSGARPYAAGAGNPGDQQSQYQQTGTGNGFSPANQWTSVTTLAPEQQKLFNSQNQISQSLADTGIQNLNRVSQAQSQPFDMSTFPALSGAPNGGDYAGLQQRATDAAMSRQTQQLNQQEESLKAQLANQGITPGSDAYNRAMQPLEQSRVDATNQAFLTGTQYENQLFNQGLAGNQFGNQARAQGIQEEAYQRSLPLNELNALRSGAQVQAPQFTQYNNAGSVQAAPIFQGAVAQGNANQQAYANQVGAYNNQQQGYAQLGTAALMYFSDRRLKRNIKRIGATDSGIPVYSFEYLWGQHAIGVMADEVQAVKPDAVFRHSSGYSVVDYARI